MDFAYNDTELQRLFAELEPRRRRQAMRGAFRREAASVRKTAVKNLRSSGIRSDRDLERGIRSLVFRQKAGFRVTIGTKKAGKNGKGEKGYHTTRQGLKKPVLLWAEGGTAERYTGGGKRHRRRHRTGRMKSYGFMSRTLEEVRDGVTSNLHREITDNVIRIARKYGCK